MTTTPEADWAVNTLVRQAIQDIQVRFAPAELEVLSDGQGGARVRFGPAPLSDRYVQPTTWLAGHITAQIPYADVYPVFVRGDLARRDGQPLKAPVTAGHNFMGQPAVQVSRRSNARDPAVETPALKFAKVLAWLNEQ